MWALDYLTLSRVAGSLVKREAQRIHLATQIKLQYSVGSSILDDLLSVSTNVTTPSPSVMTQMPGLG